MSDGRCPECGAPVAEGLDPRLLRFAPPTYVRTLAMGLSLIAWGVAACALALAGMSVLCIFLGADLLNPVIICLAALGLIAMIGMWVFTTPCPRQADVAPPSARRAARVLVPVALAYGVVLLGMRLFGGRLPDGPFYFIAGIVLAATAALVELVYVGHLARRIGNRRLIRDVKLVFWIMLSSGVTFGVCLAVGATGAVPGLVNSFAFQVITGLAGTSLVVYAGAWVLVQNDCRRHLLHTIAVAEANWAAGMRVIDGRIRPTGDPHDE